MYEPLSIRCDWNNVFETSALPCFVENVSERRSKDFPPFLNCSSEMEGKRVSVENLAWQTNDCKHGDAKTVLYGGGKTNFKDGGKVHSMCGYLLQWLRSLMLS